MQNRYNLGGGAYLGGSSYCSQVDSHVESGVEEVEFASKTGVMSEKDRLHLFRLPSDPTPENPVILVDDLFWGFSLNKPNECSRDVVAQLATRNAVAKRIDRLLLGEQNDQVYRYAWDPISRYRVYISRTFKFIFPNLYQVASKDAAIKENAGNSLFHFSGLDRPTRELFEASSNLSVLGINSIVSLTNPSSAFNSGILAAGCGSVVPKEYLRKSVSVGITDDQPNPSKNRRLVRVDANTCFASAQDVVSSATPSADTHGKLFMEFLAKKYLPDGMSGERLLGEFAQYQQDNYGLRGTLNKRDLSALFAEIISIGVVYEILYREAFVDLWRMHDAKGNVDWDVIPHMFTCRSMRNACADSLPAHWKCVLESIVNTQDIEAAGDGAVAPGLARLLMEKIHGSKEFANSESRDGAEDLAIHKLIDGAMGSETLYDLMCTRKTAMASAAKGWGSLTEATASGTGYAEGITDTTLAFVYANAVAYFDTAADSLHMSRFTTIDLFGDLSREASALVDDMQPAEFIDSKSPIDFFTLHKNSLLLRCA